jgi:predicted anti-sigma-YlaC factor YlaD
MTPELDCKEVSRWISEGLDRDLPADERDRLHEHFLICQTCRTVDEQMSFLRRAMQRLGRDDRSDR